MCVTAANQASMNLIQKLIGEDTDKVRKETVRAMRWNLDEELRKANSCRQRRKEGCGNTMDGMEIWYPSSWPYGHARGRKNAVRFVMEFWIYGILMDFGVSARAGVSAGGRRV
jgi:hypothetical protein